MRDDPAPTAGTTPETAGPGRRAASPNPWDPTSFPDRRNQMAEERTALANDRTMLAWFRTALAAYALAVAFGNILPSLHSTSANEADAFVSFGICFALVGVLATVDGMVRYRRVRRDVPDPLADGHSEGTRFAVTGVAIVLLGVAIALTLLV